MITGSAVRFGCGPVDVELTCESDRIRGKLADTLGLYNVPWPDPRTPLQLDINEAGEISELGPGRYLSCARMNVDNSTEGDGALSATFRSGAVATGNPESGCWTTTIPRDADDFWTLMDLESLASLVLAEAWRNAGWIPVHAGTVVRAGTCALLCAGSGGGKTTLTAALIRRGWQTLGDDKLLLRLREDGTPELRALVHTFNLHPRSGSWFPEVGNIEQLPVYSEWTEKRKVHPDDVWSGATLTEATPTHLLGLTRNESGKPIGIEPMSAGEVLSTLLHQTVVPGDRVKARQILGVIAATAKALSGLRVDLGDDVYASQGYLAVIEEALA
ncbi:MAG: hypothetical protein ACR2GK_12325 [Gemmatimonadaceae bacterium]